MKEFWKSFGKALLYFLLYLIPQFIVSFVYTMALSAKATMEMMAEDGAVDPLQLTETLMGQVQEKAKLLTGIAAVISLVILAIVFLIRKKSFFTETSISVISGISIVQVAVVGIGFNIVISTLLNVIPFPESWMNSYQQSSGMIGSGNMVVAVIATVLLAPVLEEITFRGLVYTRLKKGMPALVAAVITSLAFAVMHGTLIWGIYTFLFSLLLIWTFEKVQSLTANILLHIAFNATGMVLGNAAEIPDVLYWICFILGVIAFAGGVFWMYRTQIVNEQTGENA